jgi:hypothetical protein
MCPVRFRDATAHADQFRIAVLRRTPISDPIAVSHATTEARLCNKILPPHPRGVPLVLRAEGLVARAARNALSAHGSRTAMGDDVWELNVSERERVVSYGSVGRL